MEVNMGQSGKHNSLKLQIFGDNILSDKYFKRIKFYFIKDLSIHFY